MLVVNLHRCDRGRAFVVMLHVRMKLPCLLRVRHNTAEQHNEKHHGSGTNQVCIHNTPHFEETNSQSRERLLLQLHSG